MRARELGESIIITAHCFLRSKGNLEKNDRWVIKSRWTRLKDCFELQKKVQLMPIRRAIDEIVISP